MGRRRRRAHGSGHFCWCCGRHRPNERFSGKGHRRHLCKDCSKLGKEELEYRQHIRNIDQLLDWDGRIRRKQRLNFEKYLNHSDERVRVYAQRAMAHNERLREERRTMIAEDEFITELLA
ncbi:MAG: hypothetical protein JXA30_04030 [Deltaproteobacteria bacterium]|nr:hypothetical protein [Deltaproteobacteria bacterium]